MLTALLALLPALQLVAGHGYVQEITLGSTKYTGYLPYTDPYYNPVPERIVRQIPGNGPVTDLSLIDLQCNGWTDGDYYTAPAPIYGTVAAGSEVKLNWTTWPDSHKGPMITYMARAPSDITKWSPGTSQVYFIPQFSRKLKTSHSAVWFKVAESGKNSAGLWAATDLLTASNSIYTFTIPSTLKAGQYIIRHEIIALHSAYTYPGAQFYPSCIQVEVTGSGSALPTSFVSFPGAYTASTPGIVYDVYTSTSQAYPIPGPSV
ncbi:glycoside hydrolase family 61 protein [Hymenopellis radicata]|nr:glycoside hydrolase family 61 protein [Hymenopellis radicata]